ncbi:hypothetical protein [Bradyrhizobium diazoefficiens]|uniref:Uncharacterized protein n=1 Tax=Bradyrhizobium diazoefficiens TaxID=1355477 RepID=A0A809YIG8_9BRAD|nr:hypothetical protein [Bradyrhizobium diazoefficiens]BCA04158.1 hypothetical protein H12S4_50620 [Bradyrhizobium diazoefficiens]BCA21515.1 hypothetical protein BDHH15_47300 [Bradyrhizobium diazoefficiens]BCE39684.1 hypothetical protein XF3B_47150 [Bradyrhizobium diazoefficiens]BCF53080.1 hypothetical protein XF17B_47180 [Bradyrhizobium diazoefficiens]
MKVRPNRPEDQALAAQLAEACAGLSPLESALLIAEAMREVYGGTWKIAADGTGRFSIRTES